MWRRVLAGSTILAAVAAASLFVAAPASAAPRAIGLSTNGNFACAVMASHGVECWGDGTYGQLGDGTSGAGNKSLMPVHVLGIDHAIAVSIGRDHACALLSMGRIKCWGRNQSGDLGNAGTTDSAVPVLVAGILHATKVGAGYDHTCALLKGGALECWGQNDSGQLGDGTVTDRHVPHPVEGMAKNVTWVSAASGSFTCAVQLRVAKCWGYNGDGELGNGGTTNTHVPHKVSGLGTHAVIVNGGEDQACALVATPTKGNAAFCWGGNDFGQLGNGSTTGSTVPVPVSGLGSQVGSISENFFFSCAMRAGAAKCWGVNTFGQIGDGTTTERVVPRQVTGLTTGVIKVTVGSNSACALLVGGAARCWGFNTSGDLGNGTAVDSHIPVNVHLI